MICKVVNISLISCIALLVVYGLVTASAQSLTISSYPAVPQYCLAVEKSKQSIHILQRKSPLNVLDSFFCSTGQKLGDKRKEGDRKTPEGIYFLEERLNKGLDYELYGNLAYTLNYPNPVDCIQGKTGYGIWLHARGIALSPRNTKGCIALSKKNLQAVSNYVRLAETPILIGEDISIINNHPKQKKIAGLLEKKVQQWELAWEKKSDSFFSFYAPKKFSQSSGSCFADFRDNKRTYFQKYKWIDVYIDNIRILSTPSYWITYFKQYFRSPKFSSQGVKRLYWQECQDSWKIVGQEWLSKKNRALENKYLVHSRQKLRRWLVRWKEAWEKADLKKYESFYLPQARQNNRQGLADIKSYKKNLWDKEKPEKILLDQIEIAKHRLGFLVTFRQIYQGAKGYKDYGLKRLTVLPDGNDYFIIKEMWKRISKE
ncbi:MAG TPA: L,D-transpeptidase family protein [Desulfohalobiaceae bacterium]|nr:L,D-transpeptidase family protein [Desulfohalobiaceae bacterium]